MPSTTWGNTRYLRRPETRVCSTRTSPGDVIQLPYGLSTITTTVLTGGTNAWFIDTFVSDDRYCLVNMLIQWYSDPMAGNDGVIATVSTITEIQLQLAGFLRAFESLDLVFEPPYPYLLRPNGNAYPNDYYTLSLSPGTWTRVDVTASILRIPPQGPSIV